MNISDLRSPFVERVISVLSRGHEEAMKQAFYNVAAICLFIILGGAALAVYFILEPFVKPLLWAILVGSFLYPFKRNSAILTRSWLTQIRENDTLLVFGFLQFPLKAIDFAAEWIGTTIIKHIKPLVLLGLGVLFVYNIQDYIYSPSELFCALENSFWIIQSFMEQFSFPGLTRTCIVGLLGSALILVSHQRMYLFSHLAWIFIFGLIFSIAGSSLCAFLILPTLFIGLVALAIRFRLLKDEEQVQVHSNNEDDAVAVDLISPTSGLSRLIGGNIFAAAFSSLSTTPLMMGTPSPTSSSNNTDVPDADTRRKNSSNRYIYSALWFCIVVQLWRHSRLLELVPIPLAFFLLKSIGSYFNLWKFLHSHLTRLGDVLAGLFDRNKDLLFPQPIQWLYKAVVYLDRKFVKHLINQLDSVVTVVIIFVVVISAILGSVFVAVQIYGESVHLLQLGSSLVNQTLNHPEAKQWLPQGIDQMINITTVVDNAYLYGKSGIATLVKNTINEKDPTRAAQIERALLEALDRVQTAWLNQDSSQSANKSALLNSNSTFMKPPLHRRLSTQDLFNVTVIVNYGRENIGSILSILDSIWTILKGNVSLVFKSATAVLSVLIGGGTTILNFFVNGVVFLTALYYLLAASDSQYKPIQMVSLISPGAGNSLGTAMEEAIKTVCIASLKFSAFYGLWTWLIHTVFRANFVVIPAALAALLGAVPFLGTYWAAIPAALDLWLVQDRGLGAVVLMAIQFAPTLWVDAAFYAEVKGGGHPYLTGLAVAGGIFWLGIEGAIIGPLLLCVLLVVVSIYSNLFQNDNMTPDSSSSRLLHRRLLRTDTVG